MALKFLAITSCVWHLLASTCITISQIEIFSLKEQLGLIVRCADTMYPRSEHALLILLTRGASGYSSLVLSLVACVT